jgi:hypothetical protein
VINEVKWEFAVSLQEMQWSEVQLGKLWLVIEGYVGAAKWNEGRSWWNAIATVGNITCFIIVKIQSIMRLIFLLVVVFIVAHIGSGATVQVGRS